MRRSPLAVLLCALLAAVLSSLAAPVAAHAYGYPALETPSGEHLVAATPNSFTIGVNRAPHALAYRVYTSRVRAGVYAANVSSATRQGYSTTNQITVRDLPYSSSTYWYRVKTIHGNSYRWGAIYAAGVRPARPTGVQVVNNSDGLYLKWTPQWTSGYAVVQATNAAMTENRVGRKIYGQHVQFSPYGLAAGTKYYFQVRARNHGAYSAPTTPIAATAVARHQGLRVATYNVLMAANAGLHAPGSEVIAPWSSRVRGVAALLNQSSADLIGVQEAGDFVGSVQGYGGVRMVDDLVRYMPGYQLARTEVPPTEHGYHRYRSYVLYKSATWQPVGTGGVWTLDSGHYSAYHLMRSTISGATVLFSSTHLVAGHSDALDAARATETASLITQSSALAARYGVPAVYAGDFNSTTSAGYGSDAPDIAMRNQKIMDSRSVAMYHYRSSVNSGNWYRRLAPQSGASIDHVFTGPGVAVRSWGVTANLNSAGQFVGTIPSDHNPVWSTISVPV